FCRAGASFSCPGEDVNRTAKKSSERVNRGTGSRILDMFIGLANGLLNVISRPLYPENAMESKREGSINAEKPTESPSWTPIYPNEGRFSRTTKGLRRQNSVEK
ncbi:MAG: hypothetical protein NZ935_16425, partial [Planctomycetes bacterium]|nr:hypothetical protein [Planctomycetota bacterium]